MPLPEAPIPSFPIDKVRGQFPALSLQIGGRSAAFFDGPGGTQVPRSVADAVADCLIRCNANLGGAFPTSRLADAVIADAHRDVAGFLGTEDPAEVVFGANMTSLTFAFSRAVSRTWSSGDEIIVTNLDHDANVTPWVLAARERGATIRTWDIHPDDCTLDMGQFEQILSSRTRIVAVAYASNAVGTLNPIGRIVEMAHAAGAHVFVDAVHYAPHGPIDVTVLGCDYLVCSAYKFFGPHVGILWGRRELLEQHTPYKLRPVADSIPDRWMTGTQNHEGLAGVSAAVDYLASLGRHAASGSTPKHRTSILTAMGSIRAYERELLARLLLGLNENRAVRIWGIRDTARLEERVPTVSFTHAGIPPATLARRLADHGLFCWPGNFYARPLTERLGLEPEGLLRVGIVHYNTPAEIDHLLGILRTL